VVIAGPLLQHAPRHDDAAAVSGHDQLRGTAAMHEPFSRYEAGGSAAPSLTGHRISAKPDVREFEIRAGRLHEPRAPRQDNPSTVSGARVDRSFTAAGRVQNPW
jgi:hypothetical protein